MTNVFRCVNYIAIADVKYHLIYKNALFANWLHWLLFEKRIKLNWAPGS